MGKSFQDQLLALGLVDKKKAKEARKEQHQKKTKKSGKQQPPVIDENVLLARKAEEKKKARARQLNAEREAKLRKRADDARVRQLVEQNKLEKDDRGVAYRFNVQGKIQRVFVNQETADRLSVGRLGIVGLGDTFEVLPKDTIDRITEISDRVYTNLVTVDKEKSTDPDDPYAEFEVPDDLMW